MSWSAIILVDYPLIAEATRISARFSLLVFMLVHVLDVCDSNRKRVHLLWLAFGALHGLHLVLVVMYFAALGAPPELNLSFWALAVGVVVLARTMWLVASSNQSKQSPIIPHFYAWYLWALFLVGHLTRLLDPERTGPIHALLLAVSLSSGAARLVLPMWFGRRA